MPIDLNSGIEIRFDLISLFYFIFYSNFNSSKNKCSIQHQVWNIQRYTKFIKSGKKHHFTTLQLNHFPSYQN